MMTSTAIQDNAVSLELRSPPSSQPAPLPHLSLPLTLPQNLPEHHHLYHGSPAEPVPISGPPPGQDHAHTGRQPHLLPLPRLPPRLATDQNALQALVKGHFHYGYGGNYLTDHIVMPQFYDITTLKRSHVRVSDELVPKPTEINISEMQIVVPVPREHPYQSHISRYAIFPTFRSPDDPDSGVRAGTRRPLNPLIPACAPEVTVLTRTKGAPFRHEVLKVPMATKRKALLWPGRQGFYQLPKSVTSARQVFYPWPPKTVCPHATLRPWDSTLCERTANMLRNLERTHWLTSYQLNYTGSGPANPLQLDDFHERTIETTVGEHTLHTIQLRECSHPTLVPPRPQNGRKARIQQHRQNLESSYVSDRRQPGNHPCDQPGNPSDSDLLEHEHCSHDNSDSACQLYTHGIHDHSSGHGNHHSDTFRVFNSSVEPHKVQNIPERPGLGHPRGEEIPNHVDPANRHVCFCCDACGSSVCCCECQNQRSDPTDPDLQDQTPYRHDFLPRTQSLDLVQDTLPGCLGGMQVLGGVDGECPRVNIMAPDQTGPTCVLGASESPTQGVCERGAGAGLFRSQSVLLDLQDSFSRTDAHRRFHRTLRGAASNLHDNLHTGRRHALYGFNSFYFHN